MEVDRRDGIVKGFCEKIKKKKSSALQQENENGYQSRTSVSSWFESVRKDKLFPKGSSARVIFLTYDNLKTNAGESARTTCVCREGYEFPHSNKSLNPRL